MDLDSCIDNMLEAIKDGDHADVVHWAGVLLLWLLREEATAEELSAIRTGVASAVEKLSG